MIESTINVNEKCVADTKQLIALACLHNGICDKAAVDSASSTVELVIKFDLTSEKFRFEHNLVHTCPGVHVRASEIGDLQSQVILRSN
jgi:hypothetical protein